MKRRWPVRMFGSPASRSARLLADYGHTCSTICSRVCRWNSIVRIFPCRVITMRCGTFRGSWRSGKKDDEFESPGILETFRHNRVAVPVADFHRHRSDPFIY